jgi:citrate synthase
VADLGASSSRPLRRTLVAVLLESLPAPAAAGRSATTLPDASIAARAWKRLSPLRPTPARIAALDRALILLAEHELATSTLAVRIATSVRAPLSSALSCGLATLSGSAHAGAATRVHERLVRDAAAVRRHGSTPRSTPRSTSTTASALASYAAEVRAGFGHPVHLIGDPRAEPLLDAVDVIASVGARRIIAATRLAGSPAAPPNSDFALGALCYAAKMRPGAAEAIFAIARSAGWIAHAAEELDERPVRFRARAVPRPGAATPASRTVAGALPRVGRH